MKWKILSNNQFRQAFNLCIRAGKFSVKASDFRLIKDFELARSRAIQNQSALGIVDADNTIGLARRMTLQDGL